MSGGFEQVMVHCTDKDQSVKADVLNKNDYAMSVVLVGTKIKINLKRSDLKKQYVGDLHNMEFTSTGEII